MKRSVTRSSSHIEKILHSRIPVKKLSDSVVVTSVKLRHDVKEVRMSLS
jgi:hypothetical protein